MLKMILDQMAIRNAVGLVDSLSDQVPFAMSLAINRTAEEGTAALRPRIEKAFTIRENRILDLVAPRTLPRHMRATKQNPRAVIRSEDYARLLAPFETGETHKATRGVDGRTNPVIIPTKNIRPTQGTRVARSLYPINLGLVARRTINPRREGPYYYALGRNSIKKRLKPFKPTSGGRIQIKGRRGTFVLDALTAPDLPEQKRGVYQREGGKVKMLWAFRPSVPRPRALKFEETLMPLVRARLAVNFVGALAFAKRTAR
jgi:hypothetical protein